MLRITFIIVTLWCYLPVSDALGQTAQRAQDLFDRNKQAVAKIKITGTTPDGRDVRFEGSGFFVYSDQKMSFLLTAGHVIGSSETQQNRNPDWKVENGNVSRTIQIESLDENGNLILRNSEVYVAPLAAGLGLDIALLMINQSGFPTLPLADQLVEKADLHEVMLLGFPKQERSLRRPIPVGTGQLIGLRYATTVPSREGESGGPWIDLQSGKVFAVASGVKNAPSSPSNDSTPVTLIKPSLSSYFPTLSNPTAPGQSGSAKLKIMGLNGNVRVSVSGDKGALANGVDMRGNFGNLKEVRGRGDEATQCNAGSGRTFSQALARAEVSKLDANSLRFEYAIEAQGGHYRTAAMCLGDNPVGLTGHDTTAVAEAELNGVIDFEPTGNTIAVTWKSMPSQGARFRVVRQGEEIANTDIHDSGQVVLKSLPPGAYQLTSNVLVRLRNTGACCGQNLIGNSTLAIVPAAAP
jgi:hypothetical protein